MDESYQKYEQLKANHLSKIETRGSDLAELSDNDLKKRALNLKKGILQWLRERYDFLVDEHEDILIKNQVFLMKEFLPEAFALMQEVSKRLLGMAHHDEQLIAGIALHLGNTAELKNGEGKTLVAALPAYLNALFVNAEYSIKSSHDPRYRKRNVHIMTTNDYLSRRDYIWLKPVYDFLEVTVGYLQTIHTDNSFSYSMGRIERKMMYTADIVYGPAQEFIFDHLRDTTVDRIEEQVQGDYYFAIIDEADHILLDEALTPHIISGSVPNLKNEDLELVYLTNNLVSKIYQNPSLIAIDPSGSVSISWSGREILRIGGQRLLRQAESEQSNTSQLPTEFLIGLVFQFLNSVMTQKATHLPPVIKEEIKYISKWSETMYKIYQVDVKGSLQGFSNAGRSQLKNYITQQLSILPEEDQKGFEITKVIKQIIRIFTFILKKKELFLQELGQFGVTFEQYRILQSAILRATPNLLRGEKGSISIVATWIVEILNDYIVDISQVSLAEEQQVQIFSQHLLIFFNRYISTRQSNIPADIYQRAKRLQALLLRSNVTDFVNAFWAAQAFANVLELALLPVIVNMLNPQVQGGKKDAITAVVIVLLKFLREAAQLHHPKNATEREMAKLIGEFGQVVNNRVFESDSTRQEVMLTLWGNLLVDAYTEDIIAANLWSGDLPEASASEQKEVLLQKLRFLVRRCLSAYLYYKSSNEYVLGDTDNYSYDDFTQRRTNREVHIVSDLTGRIMPGRRWSQWMHSFIEAKEGLPVKPEQETLARISSQSYIGLYQKRGGLTATAHVGGLPNWQAIAQKVTGTFLKERKKRLQNMAIDEFDFTKDPVEAEFEDVYHMKVIQVPMHHPQQRKDLPDMFCTSVEAKLDGIIELALEKHSSGQPVLIETVSIEQSKEVATRLQQRLDEKGNDDTFELLNALTHEQEAEIISKAGLLNALTISTQLAGRGTDIVVSAEALQRGGLFVIGVERRESRRWDDQIRGRAGRQGDQGFSQFFIATDDKLYAQHTTRSFFDKFLVGDVSFESNLITNLILNLQVQIEHFARQRREMTAALDNVLEKYRNIFYRMRQGTLEELYACPVCLRSSMLIEIHNNAWYCSLCEKESTELRMNLKNVPRWRTHFEKMAEGSIERCLGKSALEHYLVDKYTSDVISPRRWEWDDLVQELNTWLIYQTNRKKLSEGIDFKNELYPEVERQKLTQNLKTLLVEDVKKSLVSKAGQILKDFFKRKPDPSDWSHEIFYQLSQRLGEELLITANSLDHELLRNATSKAERARVIQIRIEEIIKYHVSSYDWVHSNQATTIQLLNFFNPLLSVQQKITADELETSLVRHNTKELILSKLAEAYNRLIDKYGKTKVYEYENRVMRGALDKQWRKLLVETELIIEELRGWTTQERITDYAVRIAKIFQSIYGDAAQETVRSVLLSANDFEAEKQKEDLVPRVNARMSGDSVCQCGSGKIFAKCCGLRLYSGCPVL